MFDKDNMNGVNGWLNASGTMRIATGQSDRMFYLSCQPNTTYTISRQIVTSSFRVATYDSEPFPTMTSTNTDYSVSGAIVNNSGTSITITTGNNAKFLVVHYGHSTNDSNLQQSLDTIMINYGETALSYEPYGNVWYIEKNIGKVASYNGETISTSYISTTGQLTTGATVYYVLATPTYEIITNENLIQQLNNLQDMQLIENLCYVDWVGEEKPTMKLFCYLDKDKIIEEITG